MRIDPRLATILAALIVIAGVVIVATSGESVAVRFLTALVTFDVAVRLYARNSVGTHTH